MGVLLQATGVQADVPDTKQTEAGGGVDCTCMQLQHCVA